MRLIPCEMIALCMQEEVKLKQQLANPLNDLQDTAEKIAAISAECKLDVDAQEYMESFKPTLMDIIDKWSKVRLTPVSSTPRRLYFDPPPPLPQVHSDGLPP